MNSYKQSKALILDFYRALEQATPDNVESVLNQFYAEDAQFYGVHPFNEQTGPKAIAETFWKPFLSSWSHVQRRQDVFIAGEADTEYHENAQVDVSSEVQWVCSMGHFMGQFERPWLGIPPTNRMAFLRYANFHAVCDGKIVTTGFFCDIIGLMKQAGYNPLPPQTGASFIYPGPKTHDGIILDDADPEESRKTLDLVNRMIKDLNALNVSSKDDCPPEYLAQTWHDDMIWYGPEGIGASYTIEGYQAQHQYPFRKGLKEKVFNGHLCRFAEGDYACFFGWPNLTNSPKGGFLGLTVSNIKADMRVVDVYRREGDKLAENWVLIDFPYWLKQQGLDIFARMKDVLR